MSNSVFVNHNHYIKSMCFIKKTLSHTKSLVNLDPTDPILSQQQIKPYLVDNYQLLPIKYFVEPATQICTPGISLLPQLLSNLMANSAALLKLQQNLNQSEAMLDEACQELNQNDNQASTVEQVPREGWRSKEKVIEKLFGAKQYRYRLRLRHRFPSTIYKERNLGLNVELVDSRGERVMNSNLVNLCIAACEVDGQWIPENERGEFFIQGKTEVELYHGEAAFMKIYPRDVSRNFRNGKMSIVVYPKPSLIQFTWSATNMEEIIDADLIEPLLVKDITIRAKKKHSQ